MKVLNKTEVFEENRSTSFQGYLKASYSELTKILGEPTYNPSDDLDKSNFMWIVSFCGNHFSIYDWKSTQEYSIKERNLWHLGAEWRGNDITPVSWFISEINKHLAKLKNKNEILPANLNKIKKIRS